MSFVELLRVFERYDETMQSRTAHSLYAVGALLCAWIGCLTVDAIWSPPAGEVVFFVGILVALVVEGVVFRSRSEPRGFPIEPLRRHSGPGPE